MNGWPGRGGGRVVQYRKWSGFLVFLFSCTLTWPAIAAEEPPRPLRPVHLEIPYLDHAVSPAIARVIRIIRKFEPRLVREDLGQEVAQDQRYTRAAVLAVARYERAADLGYVMAHYNLARTLSSGRGIKRDFPRALKSFQLAAQKGNVPAMLRLAEFHLAGLGTPKDRAAAQAYYYVATSLENKGAARAQGFLAPHLSISQLEWVRKRARALREEMPRVDLILQRGQEQELLVAAAEGNLEKVETLLKNGVDANAINKLGRTSIVSAAWRGHAHIVRSLLNAGVEIDAADNQGRTGLSWAAINGYINIIDLLLQEAALVDVRDHEGLTPLMRAAWNGYEEIVDALIAGGADIDAVDDRGISALQRAEAVNEQRIAELLRARPKPRARETIVLLANDDGRVGALALLAKKPGGKEIVLNTANAMFQINPTGAVKTGTASKEFLENEFGTLLKELPPTVAKSRRSRKSVAGGPDLLAQFLAWLAVNWPLILVVLIVLAVVLLFLFIRNRRRPKWR